MEPERVGMCQRERDRLKVVHEAEEGHDRQFIEAQLSQEPLERH